jgi:hypothetical protein
MTNDNFLTNLFVRSMSKNLSFLILKTKFLSRTVVSESLKVRTLSLYSLIQAALVQAGNTKGGCITVPLTSCLTGLESAA